MRSLELAGQKFGDNLIVCRGPNKRGNWTWLRRCKCGQEDWISAKQVAQKCRKCSGKERTKKQISPEAAFNSLYCERKSSAEKRNLVWQLTKEQFRILAQGHCVYCGTAPKQKQVSNRSRYTYNGIDRVNNNIGYTPENSVSCCKWCNSAKSNRDLFDFKNQIVKMYNTTIIDADKNAWIMAAAQLEGIQCQ